ncbi:helix-hairpin-helix domain-containing protein [Empedobacter stercoris]|uniref:Helix-hairpin-helix domain-containing protein n=1 Tax=Empedobacter falsenii TaxID=343874 RepID=A0ABY8V8D6_9FLAO|nr:MULTISPECIES: helix-hairpin-helix domain-containing protein [Empedobacter]UWX66704.1 helix-hairpin-helix domain-containing protein [Empedobacter stercoris]WIH96883.1 helix-hairpin-helix domain-containing protein [Empedobacter falsenii]HJD86597.1 helix-hairpin-helix domain-containing protein [Empedobacter falsenii]
MKYLKKSTFYLNKSQRFGLYLLFVLILLFEIFQHISVQKETYELTEADKVLLAKYQISSKNYAFNTTSVNKLKDSLKPFNPNDLSLEGWMSLGFSERQAEVIIKYKGIVGGEFTSKEQIKKCYVIDEEKYRELSPFILLPTQSKSNFIDYTFSKTKVVYKNFNPNDLPQQGWEKLGFSPKQAETIMKYKQIIGGKFTSKEQIRKCFVIDDEKYAEMNAYILLPEKSKEDEKLSSKQIGKNIQYIKFNPNNYSEKDWQKLGFSSKQAISILKYKTILGGQFKTKEQIKKCYIISDEKYQEMEPYIDLPTNVEYKAELPKVENKVEKIELTEKFNPNNLNHEDWIKLGFTEQQVNTILKFKRSLGGKFKDAKTLKKCYAISEEKFNEIEPYLIFD